MEHDGIGALGRNEAREGSYVHQWVLEVRNTGRERAIEVTCNERERCVF